MKRIVPSSILVALAFASSDLGAQTMSSFTGPPPPANMVIVRASASGTLRAVASGGSSETNSADGSVGLTLIWPRRAITAVVNVATSTSPLTSGFAQSLLNPATGTGLKAGLLDYRARNALRMFGLHSYISAASRVWQSPSDSTHRQTATIWGVGALAYKQVEVSSPDTANRVALAVEFGLSLRNISGDLGGDKALRTEVLLTDRRWFYGFEGGMSTSINRITAAIQMYYYMPRVQGIGRWQMTTGLSIQADLFSFRNRPESNR